jgi:hypothetical protein
MGEALGMAFPIVHNRLVDRPWEDHRIRLILNFTEDADRLCEGSMGLSGVR